MLELLLLTYLAYTVSAIHKITLVIGFCEVCWGIIGNVFISESCKEEEYKQAKYKEGYKRVNLGVGLIVLSALIPSSDYMKVVVGTVAIDKLSQTEAVKESLSSLSTGAGEVGRISLKALNVVEGYLDKEIAGNKPKETK